MSDRGTAFEGEVRMTGRITAAMFGRTWNTVCWLVTAASIAIGLMSGCSQASADDAYVHDGDTLTISGVHWRLWGVDAPELDQTCQYGAVRCGIVSRDHLMRLVEGKQVACEPRGRSYNRIVGKCWADGVDLSAAQVEAGQAVDYRQYSHGAYAGEEMVAKSAHRGIWAGQFVMPEKWRKGER